HLRANFGRAKIAFSKCLWRYRLKVRTEPSQGSNPGSSPGIATNLTIRTESNDAASLGKIPDIRAGRSAACAPRLAIERREREFPKRGPVAPPAIRAPAPPRSTSAKQTYTSDGARACTARVIPLSVPAPLELCATQSGSRQLPT